MSTAVRTLVDTSAWIDTLRKDGDPETRRKVTELTQDAAAVVCEMVLLELWNGARGKAELAMIRELETDHHRVGLLHRDSHFDQIAAVREKRR